MLQRIYLEFGIGLRVSGCCVAVDMMAVEHWRWQARGRINDFVERVQPFGGSITPCQNPAFEASDS